LFWFTPLTEVVPRKEWRASREVQRLLVKEWLMCPSNPR